MKRWAQFGVTCALAALVLFSISSASTKPKGPGVERWSVKTSTVSGATKKTVALGDLLKLADAPGVTKNDARYQDARIPQPANSAGLVEGDLVTTEGWLHLVAGETDGDYHIQVSASQNDGNNCIVVEVPKDDATYTHSAKLRTLAAAVRAWIKTNLLKGHEPAVAGSVMTHPAFVRITGQLFYDDSHVGDQPRGKKGMKAETLWELHPVTAIAFAKAP